MALVCLTARYEMGPVASYHDAVLMLAVQVTLGTLAYCGVHAGLWFASGCSPIGIEPEVVKMTKKALEWLTRRRRKVA